MELRYAMKKALDKTEDVDTVDMVSPVPGVPVALTVTTSDGRTYTVTVQEH
ncbi:hypothetical protein OG436_29645 [Streptomyces caniferus]|uniref:hypothetical protein n=1 Tax=Streptomyces caniferus TaxID=285557 RepID=UPI002E283358|nr:hypothetical protein [Streptomyces caniferus]